MFDKSNAVKIMMYPKYVVVNKTQREIRIPPDESCPEGQTIKSLGNDYLMKDFSQEKLVNGVREYKLQIESAPFEKCEPVQLNLVGTSWVRAMNSKLRDSFEQLQVGISIEAAPVPFNKTTIITVVPYYVIINKLSRPVLIRQRCGKLEKRDMKLASETRMTPNTQATYNYLVVPANGQKDMNLNSYKAPGSQKVAVEKKIQFRIAPEK